MAGGLLGGDLTELCLGKPALRSLSALSATVGDAIVALSSGNDVWISVWNCDHGVGKGCVCIGKICMVDIISYLCKQHNNISNNNNNINNNTKKNNNSSAASLPLEAPISVLLSQIPGPIRHMDPSSSVLEAIDLMAQGVQNVVVPIERTRKPARRKTMVQKPSPKITTIHNNGQEFCWLTQEDVMRYLLGSIGLFSPLPTLSIDALGIITTEFSTVGYHSSASSAVEAVRHSLIDQMAVAVVDNNDGILIGEISASALACCDETVAYDIPSLSTADLLACIESSSSSTHSSRIMCRRSETVVVCHPYSSLAAVMIQAIAYRLNHVWVIDDDWTIIGIVRFSDILGVFRQYLKSKEESN